MKKNLNCWEYKNCGYGPGGKNTRKTGLCPAAQEARLDGVHSGSKGGRACWVVDGTCCNDKNQESFTKKYPDCMQCDFYWKVREEEGTSFFISALLMQFLKGAWLMKPVRGQTTHQAMKFLNRGQI